MSAVKAFYQWWGKSEIVEILGSQSWRHTVRGLVNTIRPPYDSRAAMSPSDLFAIIEACQWHEELTPIRVAASFAFFGFLRISNLAQQSVAAFDPQVHTTFVDVQFFYHGLLVNIKWTKTHQNTRNPVNIPLPSLGTSLLCPVHAWGTYTWTLRNQEIDQDGPLLLDAAGKPLTIPVLRRLFCQACQQAHLGDRGYTPHSLRWGGATFAYHAGVSLESIKRHGTWRSDAMEAYLFAQPNFDSPVANSFSALLNNYDYE